MVVFIMSIIYHNLDQNLSFFMNIMPSLGHHLKKTDLVDLRSGFLIIIIMISLYFGCCYFNFLLGSFFHYFRDYFQFQNLLFLLLNRNYRN